MVRGMGVASFAAICVVAVLVLCVAPAAEAGSVLHKMSAQQLNAHRLRRDQSAPRITFGTFAQAGVMPGDDFFAQVRDLLEQEDEGEDETDAEDESDGEDAALVEVGTGVTKVQSYCEICILVMQMKERGQPHLCAGLNDQYYVTCVEVLISILRADKALVYWLKNGCMHMDQTGPEIVRPCPAINICSWVPNLFSQPPSLVKDGVESLCPKDNKFLPTIPQEYKSLIPGDSKGDDKKDS